MITLKPDIIVYLVTKQKGTDEIGQEIDLGATESEVFATKHSIGQTEFYSAAQAGLEPDFKLRVSVFDYNGEKIVKVGDVLYKIYRTFEIETSEKIELYCTRASGITLAPAESAESTRVDAAESSAGGDSDDYLSFEP